MADGVVVDAGIGALVPRREVPRTLRWGCATSMASPVGLAELWELINLPWASILVMGGRLGSLIATGALSRA
jgi:hypothetical protein